MDRERTRLILRGEYGAAEVLPPRFGPETYLGWVRHPSRSRRCPAEHPVVLAIDEGFAVHRWLLHETCGSTARTLHVPWYRCPTELRLGVLHEREHGWALRRRITDATEADLVWATAVSAAWAAACAPPGVEVAPGWLLEALPAAVRALF